MALVGDELARFNEIIAAFKPLTDRLQQQNNALGATLESLGGIAAELGAWVAAGHIEPGNLARLQQLVATATVPGKVAAMVNAVSALGGIDPPLKLCTHDGLQYTPVTPAD